MKIKRVLFSVISLMLLVSMLSSCDVFEFFEREEVYTGPIEDGFGVENRDNDTDGSGDASGPVPEMAIAYRFEKSCFSVDEEIKVYLSYGGIADEYREIVPNENEVQIQLRVVNYYAPNDGRSVLDVLTVGDIQKHATIVGEEWQFGIEKEYILPTEYFLVEKGGYMLEFRIVDTMIENFIDMHSDSSPYYLENFIQLYYYIEDDMIYFSPEYNPEKHIQKIDYGHLDDPVLIPPKN